MVDSINIEDNKYNSIKVFINSNTENNGNILNIPIISNPAVLPELAANISETNSDFDHICILCIGKKSTQVVIWNKSIILIRKRLEEIYVELRGSHYPTS